MKEKTLSKIKMGLILTVCLIAMLVIDYFAKIAFDIFVLCVTLMAVEEFRSLIFKAGYPSFNLAPFIMSVLVFLLFTIGNILSLGAMWILLMEVGLMLVGYLVFFFITLLRKSTKSDDFRSATHMSVVSFSIFKANNTLATIFYPTFFTMVIYFINHITELKLSFASSILSVPYGLFGLVLLFSVCCLTDVFAMLFGSIIGGKKIFPNVSPNKTLAGSLFGLLGGLIGATLAYYGFVLICGGVFYNIALWQILIAGLLGSVIAQAGDLFESYIKRRARVKESGDFFRSHGGVLDRFDSIIMASPFIFMCLVLFLA